MPLKYHFSYPRALLIFFFLFRWRYWLICEPERMKKKTRVDGWKRRRVLILLSYLEVIRSFVRM